METIDLIIKSTKTFYDELMKDENGRFRSWEYCYSNFYSARGDKSADIDYLSLQLSFYLASWGMYRGSSFLLQKDYRIHIPVIKELLKEEYDPLFCIECTEFRKASNQKLLEELNAFMSDYYDKIRVAVKGQELKHQLSNTLITKILMGTMGCVPAYDRYFVDGIRKKKIATGNYNIKSILMLVDFYEKNYETLEKVRLAFDAYGIIYPQMKILDMGFWQMGLEMDEENKRKKEEQQFLK